jgi:glycosyltransferase involved in cell wall biosynthesis
VWPTRDMPSPLDFSRSARAPSERNVDLVVVVNGFPRLSETFILYELLDLERRGLRLHLLALHYPEEVVQQDALRDLEATVEYLPDLAVFDRKLARRVAHAMLFMRSRARYLSGLGEVIAAPDHDPSRLKQAVLLAHRIVRLGAPPVYVHFAHKPATVGRFAAILAGVPYALSAHAKDVWTTPPNELASKVRGAETVLTCTEEAQVYLAKLAGGRVPVRLARHGVEIPAEALPAPSNEVPIILGVGRLVEKKGYDVLLRAAALLRNRGIDFRLRMVGEGEEWPRLQRLVHELSLADRAIFLGPLTQEEVVAEYARADVFAMACRQLPNGDRDGTPNVIVEAMARGIPVASTSMPAIAEAIVDGESGVLAPPGNAAALADALALVVVDPALRRRLGAAARARAIERFDRQANLPAVHAALAAAGLVPAREAAPPAALRPEEVRAARSAA